MGTTAEPWQLQGIVTSLLPWRTKYHDTDINSKNQTVPSFLAVSSTTHCTVLYCTALEISVILLSRVSAKNVQVYHRVSHGVCTTGVQCLLWYVEAKSAVGV